MLDALLCLFGFGAIAVMLALYVAAFVSLGMPFAALFVGATVGCWTFIAWRRATPKG